MIILFALLLFTLLLHAAQGGCQDNYLQYIDIFSQIEYLDSPMVPESDFLYCRNPSLGQTCCDNATLEDLGNIYSKFKVRLEKYLFDVTQDDMASLNAFLDLKSIGIDTEYNSVIEFLVEDSIKQFRQEYATYVSKMSSCLQSGLRQFAGFICMSCSPDSSTFYTSGSTATNFGLNIHQQACQYIASSCKDFYKARQTINETIFLKIADIIDILASHIGEVPIEDVPKMNSFFSNSTRMLSENNNTIDYINNQFNSTIEQDYMDFHQVFENCSESSCEELIRYNQRVLKSRGSSRSSSSRSSSRGSSSSASRGGSRGGRSSSSSRSSSRTSSGSRSSRSSSRSSSSRSSSGSSKSSKSVSYSRSTSSSVSRSVSYRSSKTYIPKYTTTRSKKLYTYTARTTKTTYSLSSNKINTFFNSPFRALYIQFFPQYFYALYTDAAIFNTLPQIISPFFKLANPDATQQSLMKFCLSGSCTIKVSNGQQLTFAQQGPRQDYMKFCIKEASKIISFCNVCGNGLCDLELLMETLSTNSYFLSISVIHNKFNYQDASANKVPTVNPHFKGNIYWNYEVNNATRMANVQDDQLIRYSARVNRFIPADIKLPSVSVAEYTAPCTDSADPSILSSQCENWLCNNLFAGIVPEASRFANPQVVSRSQTTMFTNQTPQVNVLLSFSTTGINTIIYGNGSNFDFEVEVGEITADMIDFDGDMLNQSLSYLQLIILIILASILV